MTKPELLKKALEDLKLLGFIPESPTPMTSEMYTLLMGYIGALGFNLYEMVFVPDSTPDVDLPRMAYVYSEQPNGDRAPIQRFRYVDRNGNVRTSLGGNVRSDTCAKLKQNNIAGIKELLSSGEVE